MMGDQPRIESFSLGSHDVVSRVALPAATREATIAALLDPGVATETIHWQRNYLYAAHLETADGPIEVIVKQFPGSGRADRRGSKAARSWRMTLEFEARSLPTPEPVLLAEPRSPKDAAYFVTERLRDALEARYFLRAVNARQEAEKYPHVSPERFISSLGRLLRRMHDAGVWHRDLSIGNVLIANPESADAGADLYLLDLNRARVVGKLTRSQRMRDLCRMALDRPAHQRALLEAYWGEAVRGADARWLLYRLYRRAFLGRIALKRTLRSGLEAVKRALLGHGTHAHIPAAPREATPRDQIVWDHLSDQPHQHASKWQRLRMRGADAAAHAGAVRSLMEALPGVRRRYRELTEHLYAEPVDWGIAGISVRPGKESLDDLVALVQDLGARHVMVRVHPWEEDYSRELELCRRLREQGHEIDFALPQNRELVRDPLRWRAALERIGEHFTPFGRHFQIGQAVNRSKWGVWTYREYLALMEVAGEVLGRHEGVQLLGPAVIDFEFYALASIVNSANTTAHFDVVTSLLYVDRRGAPENRQLGFDTVGKAVLLRAIAGTARLSEDRCWIPEFNWPLWEGPHSPAGKAVSVDEETQASYLVRYFLLVLGTGLVERVYWWQLIARGYGLVERGKELRRRPSFRAMASMIRQLGSSSFLGPVDCAKPAHLYRFRDTDGSETFVGWSSGGPVDVELPGRIDRVTSRDGDTRPLPAGRRVTVTGAPTYFRLA